MEVPQEVRHHFHSLAEVLQALVPLGALHWLVGSEALDALFRSQHRNFRELSDELMQGISFNLVLEVRVG